MSFCLSICLSIYLSICLSMYLSIYLHLKTKLFCETSSVFELDNFDGDNITKQFCETSFKHVSSSLLFSDPSHLFFSSVHIVGSLTSKLTSMTHLPKYSCTASNLWPAEKRLATAPTTAPKSCGLCEDVQGRVSTKDCISS